MRIFFAYVYIKLDKKKKKVVLVVMEQPADC